MVSQGGHLLTWALATSWAELCCHQTGGDTSFVSRALARPTQLLWESGGWVPACSYIHCALGSGNAKGEPRAGAGHGTWGCGTAAVIRGTPIPAASPPAPQFLADSFTAGSPQGQPAPDSVHLLWELGQTWLQQHSPKFPEVPTSRNN